MIHDQQKGSPDKIKSQWEGGKPVEELHPNQEQEEDQKGSGITQEDLKKTLAINQRLMDVADNTNALLDQYANGGDPVNHRMPERYMLFFQKKKPII